MNMYDADLNPDPEEWLAVPESERLDLIVEYHDQLEHDIPSMEAHCSMHAVIENQLAMDSPPLTKITMARLLTAGVSRHEAVHAIANAMKQELFLMMKSNEGFKEARYCKALRKLDPKVWIRKDNKQQK